MFKIVFALLSVFLFANFAVYGQSAPAIEFFTVDNSTLSYPDVEGGTAAALFSWRAVGLREGDQMRMQAWVGGQWVLIGEGFEPEKSDTLVIAHPLDFIMPKYRLSVVDASGAIVAEQTLELSYAAPEAVPYISMFLAFAPRQTIPLSAFDQPFRVQWQVFDRWFNSNILLEQVLPDGTVVNVEHPQARAWQYAHATADVQLIYPGDYQDVVLQLRVVNRDDGTTLVQRQMTLHVENEATLPPEVVSFNVTPQTAEPGGAIQVSWEVLNTDAVFIEYLEYNASRNCVDEDIVYELPPSGTLDLLAPEDAFREPQFRLFADYYLPEPRGQCASLETPLDVQSVELTDYVGQGVEYFRVEPLNVLIGDTVTLSWSVTEGESVTIDSELGTVRDLPLTGSIDITIPDLPRIRSHLYGFDRIQLYIIESGITPLIGDAYVMVFYDRDGDLDCDPVLDTTLVIDTYPALPDTDVVVTWDSCGNETVLLRLALITGGYGADPVSEEFIPVDSSGTTTLRLPNAEGRFYIQLYYEHEGERHRLKSARMTLEEASG